MGSARRLASRRAGPWAPLAGSLRAGQATKDPLPVASVGVADPSQAQDDKSCMKCWEAFSWRRSSSSASLAPAAWQRSSMMVRHSRSSGASTDRTLLRGGRNGDSEDDDI